MTHCDCGSFNTNAHTHTHVGAIIYITYTNYFDKDSITCNSNNKQWNRLFKRFLQKSFNRPNKMWSKSPLSLYIHMYITYVWNVDSNFFRRIYHYLYLEQSLWGFSFLDEHLKNQLSEYHHLYIDSVLKIPLLRWIFI